MVYGSGQWMCVNGNWYESDMQWRVCVAEPTLEACGADPSRDACTTDSDCGNVDRAYCDRSEDECVSSSCSCDDAGTWTCTPDCSGRCKMIDAP